MLTINKDFLKTSLKYLGYGSAVLVSGFFLFVLKHRKDLAEEEHGKHIPVDKLERLVNKIKHLCVHVMIQTYDKKVKLKGRKGGDDIEVFDESEKGNDFFKAQQMNLIELQRNTSALSETNSQYKEELPNDEKIDAEILKNIFLIELELIKRAGYEPIDYYDSLKKHMNNEKIKSSLKIINDFKTSLQNRTVPHVDFGESISKNYLKIISNIFYLNLRKVQKQLKDNIIDKEISVGDSQETFNKLYKKYLKETRFEVLKFFQVTHPDVLSSKVLLRIYVFFYEKENELRKNYEKMNEEVNQLIKKIVNTGCVDELYDDNHPEAITGPVDKIIDFSHFFSVPKISDNQRILNTYKNYEDYADEYEDAD